MSNASSFVSARQRGRDTQLQTLSAIAFFMPQHVEQESGRAGGGGGVERDGKTCFAPAANGMQIAFYALTQATAQANG